MKYTLFGILLLATGFSAFYIAADDPSSEIAQQMGSRGGGGGRASAPRPAPRPAPGPRPAPPAARPQAHPAPHSPQRPVTPQPRPPARTFSTPNEVSRTPSMSRSINEPHRQEPYRAPQRPPRPPQSQHQIQPHNLQAREQIQNFIRERPQQRTQLQNPENFQLNRNLSPSFQPGSPVTPSITTNQQLLSTRSDLARTTLQTRHPGRAEWFTSNFFYRHNCYPYYAYSGANWWWAPSWGAVAGWLPYNWVEPYYYSDSGVAYTLPPESYQLPPDQFVAPPEESQDFLPLGVFAAGQTAAATAYTTMFVQLAVDRAGNIAGTYYNSATEEVHELDGLVDQYTQEAAWKVSDNPNSPTMTTGLYNLTQDAAIVQVHFTDGSVQPWVFVRLNK